MKNYGAPSVIWGSEDSLIGYGDLYDKPSINKLAVVRLKTDPTIYKIVITPLSRSQWNDWNNP